MNIKDHQFNLYKGGEIIMGIFISRQEIKNPKLSLGFISLSLYTHASGQDDL